MIMNASFRLSMEKSLGLTLCPTAIWERNATTVAELISGVSGSNSTALNRPFDVYIDNNNTIYVLDSGNYRVQLIFPNSTMGTTVIEGAALSQSSDSRYSHCLNDASAMPSFF